MSGRTDDETVVKETTVGLVVMWAAFPMAGAAAAWLIKVMAGWIADLPWAPLQGPFRLIAELTGTEPQATLVALGVGAAVGFAMAFYVAAAELTTVAVADGQTRIRRGGSENRVPRDAAAAVFVDDGCLIMLDDRGAELIREPSDLPKERLRDAFQAHAHPWFDTDPHEKELRRWVAGLPELPSGADALFKARERALKSKDTEDAADLRAELAVMGIVVRDRDGRQYWRRLPTARS